MPDGGWPVTVTAKVLRNWPLAEPGADKNTRGRVVIVAGSRDTPGAALLAAVAALRSGAGKLQVATVASAAAPLAVAVPEGLVRGLPETASGALAPDAAADVVALAAGADAVLLGPGLADAPVAAALAGRVLGALDPETTVVLDALGLAVLGDAPDCLRRFSGRAILTPNTTELGILAGVDEEAVEREPLGHARAAADRYGAVVLLGATSSYVTEPGSRAWIDDSGGTGLAVSGSGDALAGVVAGLVARGAEPAQAAVWAAYLHGRAGDRLAARVGRLGYLAREVVDEVPRVLTELEA